MSSLESLKVIYNRQQMLYFDKINSQYVHKRPYLEILVSIEDGIKLYKIFESQFIIIFRDHLNKIIKDNLYTLVNLPLQKDQLSFDSNNFDPYNILFFKTYGQYGLATSFISDNNGKLSRLLSESSFYDTKELREFELNDDKGIPLRKSKYKDKSSMLIFTKNQDQDIVEVLHFIEKCVQRWNKSLPINNMSSDDKVLPKSDKVLPKSDNKSSLDKKVSIKKSDKKTNKK